MPIQKAKRKAKELARQGKRPTTQAGAFVREQMHELKSGQGTARSRKQAIAIGLSQARREGVRLGRSKGSPTTRRKPPRARGARQ
jgi:hypothetical protein